MQAGATGNADEVIAALDALMDTFDLTLPGENGSFGEDLCDIFSQGVFDRTIGRELDADGNPLAPNRGKYGEHKRAEGLPVGIGTDPDRSEQMLSLVQLKGERDIQADHATIVYGTTQGAKDKANWFTYGSSGSSVYWEYSGAKNQPPRRFWDFDDDINSQLVARCEERLDRAVKILGG